MGKYTGIFYFPRKFKWSRLLDTEYLWAFMQNTGLVNIKGLTMGELVRMLSQYVHTALLD